MRNLNKIIGLLIICLFAGNQAIIAQDPRVPRVKGRTLNTRTSPFAPPEDTDRSFSTDKAPKLDTGCIFRGDGPITYTIEIKRYLGPLNSDGTLEHADDFVRAGILSRDATLIMPAFDVDSSGGGQGVQPELDKVTINGFEVGFLRGQDNQWVNNSFKIPIEKIKFAEKGTNGGEPTGGLNEIRIDIDTANSSEQWCTSIDWGAANFRAMSPVILIHGNNSDGCFFFRQGLTTEFDDKKVVYDKSIQLNPNPQSADPCPYEKNYSTDDTHFVSTNGATINSKIPGILRQWGAKNVHLIAHSKGGLDAREYLAKYQPSHNEDYKILSLTTLGTPHNGSVLADISVARVEALANVDPLGDVSLKGFPLFTQTLAALIDGENVDPGRRNLTTGFVSSFNRANLPRLGRNIAFNTVAGDADTNFSQAIDLESEITALKKEDYKLRNLPLLRTYVVDRLYQNLRLNRGVSVSTRDEIRVLPGQIVVTVTIIVIRPVPNPTPLGNDTLVTLPSGHGEESIQSFTSHIRSFVGGEGRNHSNIADGGVAQIIIPWLIEADRSKGGLK